MIEVKNLNKSFGSLEVLKDINFTVNEGEVFSIIGPSGTGKSTLLRCLNLLEYPDEGEITIDGFTIKAPEISNQEANELRRKSAMIFQSFNLFSNLSVLQNITVPLRSATGISNSDAEKVAIELLEKIGMSDKAENFPITLSGGQMQRAAIARSLALKPKVLLFDEPTSALDPAWVQEVLAVMRQLADENYTMLIVTHEMEFAKEVSDKIIIMEAGRIINIDTPDKVFRVKDNTNASIKIKDDLKFRKSLNHLDLVPLFAEAGLEIDDDIYDTDNLLMDFVVTNRLDDELIGTASLYKYDDIYQIKTFAIKPKYQRLGIGRDLLKYIIKEIHAWNADKVYVVAKQPGFYSDFGFIDESNPPDKIKSSCNKCERFGRDCNSKVMVYNI